MRISEPGLRRRNEAEIHAAAAIVLREAEPAEAHGAATRAINYFGQHGGELFLPGLFLARSRAARTMNALGDAESDARLAIAAFERQRNSVSESAYRERLFEDGWNAYEELIDLRVGAADSSGALEIAERARARTLLEDLVGARDVRPAPVADIQRRLPTSAVVVFFVLRSDRLWIWVVSRGQLRGRRRMAERVGFFRPDAPALLKINPNR